MTRPYSNRAGVSRRGALPLAAITMLALLLGVPSRPSLAAPSSNLAHLGPARRVNSAERARLEKLAHQPGGYAAHLESSLGGKANHAAQLATLATAVLSPEQSLLKALAWSTLGYLTFDKQLDRLASHTASDRAFARAELRRLDGTKGAANEKLKGAAWRLLESTSRGGLAGASALAFLSGLWSTQGISTEAAVKATAIGTAGGAATGFVTGLGGALKRTLGRAASRGARDTVFRFHLKRAERALATLLAGEVEADARGAKVERLEGTLRNLLARADRLGALDEKTTQRVQRLLAGFGALAAFGVGEADETTGAVEAPRSKSKKGPSRAPHRRLARLGMLGLVLTTLATQGLVGRLPIESMPSDFLQDPARQQLAEVVWKASHDAKVREILDKDLDPMAALSINFGGPARLESAWSDARLYDAFKAATNIRYQESTRTQIFEAMGTQMKPQWKAEVLADVEHFYFAAWMSSQGGPVFGAPVSAALSATYEFGIQPLLQAIGPKTYNAPHQVQQFFGADLPGAGYGALSTFVQPPTK